MTGPPSPGCDLRARPVTARADHLVGDHEDGVVPRIDTLGTEARLAFRISGPSLRAHLALVRRRVSAWLRAHGVDDETVEDIVLATHEALANAADHAFPDGGGEVRMVADWQESEELSVVVEDTGRWRPPPADPGTRGHGLTLISGLAQRSTVHATRTGTRVEMYWRFA